MFGGIKPLGDLVTTLPAGPEYPGRTAGPSFELFYESDYVLPHREAAWLLLTERLRQAADFCEPGGPCDPAVTDGLGTIRAALNGIADSLAVHLPPRYAPAPAEDRATLLARAQDFYQTGQALPAPDPSTPNEVAALLGEVYGALQGPEPSPWDLAVSATTLRARLGAEAPPVLLEAVAFLQDLAIRQSPPGDRAARTVLAMIGQLGRLQRDLPPAIMTAKNGPYLVTNVTTLRTPAGEEIPVPPTIALCRCGGSAAKPSCDGACATNGFTDAKDPNRVPDQRDIYPGTQVTIFDNRGICQHSGLCTDRAPVAFRTNAEPFVAPSGARLDELIRAVRDCPSGALSLAFDRTEQRDLADWHGIRERAIEVTKDGPYRVTGGIPLTDADGAAVPRAQGSSLEHYALCRCGHSQNKPFCSGMHWYVDFRDPAPSADPTLFEWAGGLPGLTRLTRLLYEKLIPADDLLAPLFAAMAPGGPQAEAAVMAEAFGGPSGAAPRPLPEFTEEQRARWVALAVEAAQEAVLPADPSFRSALSGYLEWRSRSAGATAPRWDWGPAGVPSSTETSTEPDTPVALPGPDETVSFAAHIKPLFRERDRKSMSFAFDLWSQADVQAHAAGILARLRDGTMPCDGAWPAGKIDVFRRWTETGCQP
jgi:CDGSH-type Zn-finger protein/truncated hemoglobin YjbI